MHKCINKSVGNIYHLEQLVDNFFPYSQKQLGFDKPCSIIFQSDKKNSQRMLGKTAHYDPAAHEVYLYIDGRHPKDVMRSLSHELVHHAQNCRGDFTGAEDTSPGYAQTNPHMRKMEREAYTKGNLIFRDFEDLIKTGKITIDIDFTKSGEPKMSLKEWKNNELNMLMMKKWGLLKETKEETLKEWAPGHEPAGETHDFTGAVLKGAPKGTKARHSRWYAGDTTADSGGAGGHRDRGGYAHDDPESEEYHTDAALEKRREYQRWKISAGIAEDLEVDELEEGGMRYRGEDEPEEDAWGKTRRYDDPIPALSGEDYEGIQDPEVVNIKGDQPGMAKKLADKGAPEFTGGRPTPMRSAAAKRRLRGPRPIVQEKKMISVKEAKRLTHQIIERYLAEKK